MSELFAWMGTHWFQSMFFGLLLFIAVGAIFAFLAHIVDSIGSFFAKRLQKPEPKVVIQIKLNEKDTNLVTTGSSEGGDHAELKALVQATTETMQLVTDPGRPNRYDVIGDD